MSCNVAIIEGMGNAIDGYRFLRALFIALPRAQTVDDYAQLLPWRIDLAAS